VKKDKKLIIFGLRDYAQIVFEYFTHDSSYEVTAFTVDADYIKENFFMGRPVIAFEEIEKSYPPSQYEIHVAVVYGELNRVRQKICEKAKAKGYKLASYISSHAFVWHNAEIGEHCFIFENNTIQPFSSIGNNNILWSGNHIGHHSKIGNNCFISSHVVISGFCDIGDNCFLGVNCTLGNHIKIGKDCWISPGTMMSKDISEHSLVPLKNSESMPLNEAALFRHLRKIG
jgi:sugar O-acyltransferase (sialic acid O-acetyltransferase NeuD family)